MAESTQGFRRSAEYVNKSSSPYAQLKHPSPVQRKGAIRLATELPKTEITVPEYGDAQLGGHRELCCDTP